MLWVHRLPQCSLTLVDSEVQALSQLSFVPPVYLRYLDDTFAIVPTDNIRETVDVFNNIDSRTQFTYEVEENHRFKSLDVTMIKNVDRALSTNWYQKPIFRTLPPLFLVTSFETYG